MGDGAGGGCGFFLDFQYGLRIMLESGSQVFSIVPDAVLHRGVRFPVAAFCNRIPGVCPGGKGTAGGLGFCLHFRHLLYRAFGIRQLLLFPGREKIKKLESE